MGGMCSFFNETSGEEFVGIIGKSDETEKMNTKTVRFEDAVNVIKTSEAWSCEKCRKEIGQPRYRTTAPDTDSTINQAIQKLLHLPDGSEGKIV